MKMLLISHHTLFRDGIKLLLKKSGILDQYEEADDLRSSLHILKSTDFDLVFLDVRLRDALGLDSLRGIKQTNSNSPVIAISDYVDFHLAKQAMELGAAAFVSKTSSYEELLRAIDAVTSGKLYLSPELSQPTAQRGHGAGNSDLSVISSLSDRQKEVLKHIARGASNKGISIEMNISQNTVKAHLATIFKILGVHNRTEAFYFAARAGMPLDD